MEAAIPNDQLAFQRGVTLGQPLEPDSELGRIVDSLAGKLMGVVPAEEASGTVRDSPIALTYVGIVTIHASNIRCKTAPSGSPQLSWEQALKVVLSEPRISQARVSRARSSRFIASCSTRSTWKRLPPSIISESERKFARLSYRLSTMSRHCSAHLKSSRFPMRFWMKYSDSDRWSLCSRTRPSLTSLSTEAARSMSSAKVSWN